MLRKLENRTRLAEELGFRLEDIAHARASGDKRLLSEASLGRVFRHYQDSGRGNGRWAILTAWRSDAPADVNRSNMAELKRGLRSSGYGFMRLHGAGQEEDPATGELHVSHEPSLFVPGMTFQHAHRLASKYGQYSFIHAGPETDGKVHHHVVATGEHEVWSRFHPKLLAKYHSLAKSRRTPRQDRQGVTTPPHSFYFDAPDSPATPFREEIDADLAPEPDWEELWFDYTPLGIQESMWLEAWTRRVARREA